MSRDVSLLLGGLASLEDNEGFFKTATRSCQEAAGKFCASTWVEKPQMREPEQEPRHNFERGRLLWKYVHQNISRYSSYPMSLVVLGAISKHNRMFHTYVHAYVY